ncbi:MAG: hypothetical protein JO284_17025 [Planctomycetaceae bacterium]|nr:hypothetical protein [Planctomycetaceae bacterium]
MSSIIVHPDPVRGKREREPFAALPHTACVSDLSDAAYRVLGAVLFFARRGSCDATDHQLGQRSGKSVPAIKRSLRELEAKGWIERLGRGGPFRVIRLRAPEDPARSEGSPSPRTRDQGAGSGVGPHRIPSDPPHRIPSDPVPDQGRSPTGSGVGPHRIPSDPVPDHSRSPLKTGEGDGRNVTSLPPPGDAAASPRRPQEPRPGPAPAPRPSAPVRPLRDELKALPGADAAKVRSLAWRLAHHLKDLASVGFFLMALGLVARRLTPVERLLAAFVVADRSRDTARKPGAIFASAWTGWTPPPLPSEINRPTYFQAPRPPEAPEAPPAPAPGPMAPEDELAELRRLIAAGGPVARMARVRLAALGAGVAAEGRPTEAAPDRSH